MRASRRHAAAFVLITSFAGAGLSIAEDLPRLFQKVKQNFRLGSYADALTTLDRLEAESEKAGNEALRSSLRPGLVFYRGACLAALGRAADARSSFEEFLSYEPNASLDPSMYPRKVVAALDAARKSAALDAARKSAAANSDSPAPPPAGPSLAASYGAFRTQSSTPAAPLDESWADGPIHYLLTSDEHLSYSRISDAVARSEFVTEFWRKRDPNPQTPENEFREEFERRVAFADARMSQDETRGSLTDRGMVFILLGPPTYIGRKPLRTGDDTADPAGMSMYSDSDVNNALRSAGGNPTRAANVFTQMTGPNNRLPDPDGNYREVWHYRRELLPPGVSYFQVDFEFITRKGYGKNVMQRDDQTLSTLETARKSMRAGIVPQRASR